MIYQSGEFSFLSHLFHKHHVINSVKGQGRMVIWAQRCFSSTKAEEGFLSAPFVPSLIWSLSNQYSNFLGIPSKQIWAKKWNLQRNRSCGVHRCYLRAFPGTPDLRSNISLIVCEWLHGFVCVWLNSFQIRPLMQLTVTKWKDSYNETETPLQNCGEVDFWNQFQTGVNATVTFVSDCWARQFMIPIQRNILASYSDWITSVFHVHFIAKLLKWLSSQLNFHSFSLNGISKPMDRFMSM